MTGDAAMQDLTLANVDERDARAIGGFASLPRLDQHLAAEVGPHDAHPGRQRPRIAQTEPKSVSTLPPLPKPRSSLPLPV